MAVLGLLSSRRGIAGEPIWKQRRRDGALWSEAAERISASRKLGVESCGTVPEASEISTTPRHFSPWTLRH